MASSVESKHTSIVDTCRAAYPPQTRRQQDSTMVRIGEFTKTHAGWAKFQIKFAQSPAAVWSTADRLLYMYSSTKFFYSLILPLL